jgi:hypothetical protein
MANVPISIRLDPAVVTRLHEAAKAAGRSVAGHAADLVRAGLAGDSPPTVTGGEHPLVAHVIGRFARLDGADVDAQRECALALARVAAAGGAPTSGAVRELRVILAEVEKLLENDDFGDALSVPTMPDGSWT